MSLLKRSPWRHWLRDVRVSMHAALAEEVIGARVSVLGTCGGHAVFLVTSPTKQASKLLKESGYRYQEWLLDNSRGKHKTAWCYSRRRRKKHGPR